MISQVAPASSGESGDCSLAQQQQRAQGEMAPTSSEQRRVAWLVAMAAPGRLGSCWGLEGGFCSKAVQGGKSVLFQCGLGVEREWKEHCSDVWRGGKRVVRELLPGVEREQGKCGCTF